MKRILGTILALLAGAAPAQTTTPTADSWEMRQRNEANNGIYVYYIVPDGAVDQIPTYNGSTNKPEYSKLGTGLSRTGTTLNVSLSASQITGTTATGQALMTATDAAAARTAIGAGSSNFNGAYGSLTGLPTLFDGQYSSLTGIPSTFTPAAHTHSASQISDSTTTGRAVMTATDAAAARTAIGAGTVTSITAGTGLSGGTITTSGTISLPNTGTASTYSGVTTDAQGRVTAGTTRSFAYQTRALNTCFQISSTRDVLATYAVDISTTLSLAGGTVGTVYLRIYTNSGCSTGTQEISRFVNGNTGTLTIGLNISQNVTATLTGIIPAGSYVQLVTENNTGSPSFTARPGAEVLL